MFASPAPDKTTAILQDGKFKAGPDTLVAAFDVQVVKYSPKDFILIAGWLQNIFCVSISMKCCFNSGYNGGSLHNTTHYDSESKKWTKKANLPVKVYYHAACLMPDEKEPNRYIIVAGGSGSSDGVFK